jgi:hypothetical protein
MEEAISHMAKFGINKTELQQKVKDCNLIKSPSLADLLQPRDKPSPALSTVRDSQRSSLWKRKYYQLL